MERYTLFLDWKNQCCEDDYTTQSNLEIQCNPYQTDYGIFPRTRPNNFTICMESQKIPIAKAILRKNNRTEGIYLPYFRLLQSYSHKDRMVLTQKQKYRSMEQDSLKINSRPMVTLSLTK